MTTAGVDPVVAVDVWPTTRLLRASLRANTVFSLGSGLVLAAGGAFIAEPWALGPAVLPPAVGVAVAGFGVLVARLAVQQVDRLRRGTRRVVAADLLWVLGTIALLAIKARRLCRALRMLGWPKPRPPFVPAGST